jgi:hypothetical protein
MAIGKLELEFTGVSVMLPSGCSTPATLRTNPLEMMVEMDYNSGVPGTAWFETFRPVNHTTNRVGTLVLTNCAAAGSYPITGSFAALAQNATGVAAVNQPLLFNAASALVSNLVLGTEGAKIEGESNNELVSGESFGALEE